MSPPEVRTRVSAASLAAGVDDKGRKQSGLVARLLGSGTAGILELLLFHPVDTITKRLTVFESRVIVPGKTMQNLNIAIFKDKANSGMMAKYASLFPGITFGAAYKVLQRVYKFGGQPFVRDAMHKYMGKDFENAVGKRHAKTLIYATAGSIMGVGEIILLPLDVLKIKAQTNPESLRGRGIVRIIQEEGWHLYRGAGWTAARNAPGSFALFGGSAFVKEYVLKLESYSHATFLQDSLASVAGAVASITVAQPLDVIKTRIQKRDFGDKTSGVRIVTDLISKEGFGAFFKGLTPKLVVVGPKLVFAFVVAQQAMAFFAERF